MNKRIEELAAQCRTVTDYGMGKFETFDAQKFADLLVRECAAMTRNLSAHGELAEKAVKDYFGIGE